MNTVEVSTDVRVPIEEAYAFVADFPRYAKYSEYLQSVTQHGSGGVDTEYELTFAWWKLTHAVRSRVTDTDEPEQIDWKLVDGIDAHGRWEVAETADGARVTLVVTYDTGSARGALDLPRLVSLDWVVDKVVGLVVEEGERVVERVVADLEGERRPVELAVETY
ncbi:MULTISPECIES: type II toxin-antitoxin system RatA family toxin [unclassified Halobacterium]|uniref:SRPBCC family protein n=1 Tax=Halobacterium sp. NMX12-1 TaxID=3166650 RepID=A0AAU8CA90_9EURY|nr:SRPBCC family protein [Halobacterium sp. KA-6]MCD2202294.1 SRPBCC family protein [Halobacterium sp. KA-6]